MAALSLGAAIGTFVLSGVSVDNNLMETFALAFVNFLGATGTWFLAKKD